MELIKNIFVFVVCGGREHIDTLHFSLRYLRHFSKNQIIVLTDSTRNEIPVKHDWIIDVKTPEHFDHHQASIYLKTGIHKFVPMGNKYCYLDTDVVALSQDVDHIFEEYVTPITFAQDHCALQEFSPFATTCSCFEKWEKEYMMFNAAIIKYFGSNDRNRNLLNDELENINQSFYKKIKEFFRFNLSKNIYVLNKTFYYEKNVEAWFHESGELVMYDNPVGKVEALLGYNFDREYKIWYNKQNQDIAKPTCNHLKEAIFNEFKVVLTDEDWQHWNGGVFLFDDYSHDFLTNWHNKTMKIFEWPEWKTRDQGTLIASAWEFDLKDHKTLNKKWNFIADYNNTFLDFDAGEGVFTDDSWKTKYKPAFIHIYHHWGDENWAIWNFVKNVSNGW